MVLYEAVSDFSPNLVRIFERGLDSQQSRILTACCFNIADISHLSKSEMHAWTFLSCLNFWTDWQWVENTRKSGSCAILIHLRSELRTQLPLWPHFLLWAPSTPQLQVRPQLFSMFLQKSHENSEIWPKMGSGALERLCESSLQSCTVMNRSWNLAGCSGLVTHCTQSSAPNPHLTGSSGSSSGHSSRLWADAGLTASPGSLFHAWWYRWGYRGEGFLQGMLHLRARGRRDYRKKDAPNVLQIWFFIRKVISQLCKYTVILCKKKKKKRN